MGQYKKLIAAIVGVIAIIAGPEVLGLTTESETVAQTIMGLLTAFGVFQVTNTPAADTIKDMRSPPLVGFAAILLAAAALGGCVSTLGVDNERLNTANKQLADKVLFVETLANFATRLVRSRVITANQGRQVGGILQRSLNTLNETQASISRNGDPSQAQDALDRVDQSLAIVLDLLTTFAPASTSAIETYRHRLEYARA